MVDDLFKMSENKIEIKDVEKLKKPGASPKKDYPPFSREKNIYIILPSLTLPSLPIFCFSLICFSPL